MSRKPIGPRLYLDPSRKQMESVAWLPWSRACVHGPYGLDTPQEGPHGIVPLDVEIGEAALLALSR